MKTKYNTTSFPTSLKGILAYLDTDLGLHLKDEDKLERLRKNIKSSRLMSVNNPNPSPAHNEEVDTPEEATIFYLKCRIAIIKSIVFAGYTVFASLLGTGGMSLTIPNIGGLIIANPFGVVIGMSVVFMASFFTSLMHQLKLEELDQYIKK